MQADILKGIDVLVDMAESSSDIETLKAELKEIEKDSNRLKNELDFLSDIVPEEKYFRASERQVDENIKVSLEAKIKKQEKAIQELKQELATALEIEQSLHDKIADLNNQIATTNEYIAVLKKRISSTNSSINTQYQEVLTEENKKLEHLESNLNDLKKEYETITEKINFLNLAKSEMENKLTNEKTKLNNTKSSLVNPSTYIDYDMKKLDDDRIVTIKSRLLNLDKRRLEILTDPAMIAGEAKDLIMEDDRTSALSKVRELVTIVKTKPFMDIPNGNDLNSLLHDELISASDKRDEFAAVIDSKNYSSGSNHVVKERIEFLKNEIKFLEDQITSLEQSVKKMDEEEFNNIKSYLESAKNRLYDLQQQIVMYEEIMSDDEADKSPRRKAILNASLNKKQEELQNVLKVIASYEEDEKELILKTNKIIEEEIPAIRQQITTKNDEINKLNKLMLSSTDVKDVLAIETDKRKLKELDDVVKSIKHRQKYNRTPSEIFDEIEIYFGTLDTKTNNDEVEVDNTLYEEPTDSNLNYEYQDIPDYEIEIPVEENNSESSEIITEEIKEEPVLEKFDIPSELPTIEDIEKEITSDRIKVISVEKIDKPSSNKPSPVQSNEDESSDFIIGEYKDDDYLDMSSILENNEVV